jgi:hypothetical protein
MKIWRDLKFFKVMDGGVINYPESYEIYGGKRGSQSELDDLDDADGNANAVDRIKPDRFWLGFESGDQEALEYNGETEVLYLIEAEKQKEHEAILTGHDYNRNLGLFVTSCAGGIVRIWSQDKLFLREISFPHPVDSVCFFNSRGDILVSHEKRVSRIDYERYTTGSFDYVAENQGKVNLLPCSEELFEELKEKDDVVRGKRPGLAGAKKGELESPRKSHAFGSPTREPPGELKVSKRMSTKQQNADKEELHRLEKARQRGIAKSTQDLIDIAEQKAKEQIEEMRRTR